LNKIRICSCMVFYVAAGCVLMSSTAVAGFLYGNGPVNGNFNAFAIDEIQDSAAVTDSFTLSTNANLTTIDFVAWVTAGDTPDSVDWAITGSDFGGPVFASGTDATLVTTHDFGENGFGDEVFGVSFSVPGSLTTGSASLTAGNYWLQLDNGDTAQSGIMGWDENDGPSSAAYSATVTGDPATPFGSITPLAGFDCTQEGCTGSETFRILGDPTPEPGTVTLLLSGFLLMAGASLYKKALRQPLPQPARIQPRN
jgi:hypothetical protein